MPRSDVAAPSWARAMRFWSAVGAVLALLAMASTGHGQPAPESSTQNRGSAEALFEEGRVLKDGGKCEAALEKFLASQALDQAVGTQLNIADCYTQLGRTASAWTFFREAANAARAEGDARRASFAQKRADELAPRLCRLRIEVASAVDGQQLSRNKSPVAAETWGVALPVDPGEQHIVARADGHRAWESRVQVNDEGATVEVTVPALQAIPVGDEPSSGPHPQEIGGWSVFGVGAAAMVVGLVLFIRSRSLDDASDFYCPTTPSECLPEGAELREEARSFEQSAIVVLAAGAAAAGVGLTVVLTAPTNIAGGSGTNRVTLFPMLGPHHAGIALHHSW